MNHLVNLYLSRNLGDKMLGCLIGEVVRTSNVGKYTLPIIEGIELNKRISNFVKEHPAYERSCLKLNARYTKHASKIIDIFYDHFLAANWAEFSEEPLSLFAERSYSFMSLNKSLLPYKHKKLLAVMVRENWLVNFSSINGIHQYMKVVTSRDTFQTNLEYSLEDLINQYGSFKADFDELFSELLPFVENEVMKNNEKIMQVA